MPSAWEDAKANAAAKEAAIEEAAKEWKNHLPRDYLWEELTEEWREVLKGKMRAAIATYLAHVPRIEWESFCDEAYYHNWAVRPVGEKRWGFCFHLPTREEAEGLRALLNEED